MRTTSDTSLHSALSETLVRQLIRTTSEALEQHGVFDIERKKDIAKDLLFGICSVLDGSAYPGSYGEKEIAPFIGFYLDGDTEQPLVPENGSSMHVYVCQIIDASL